MNNKYINNLEPYIKSTLIHAQLENINQNDVKSIKREYIIKMIISDIFLFMFVSTITIIIAFNGTMYTNEIILIGCIMFLLLFGFGIFFTFYCINDTSKKSYSLKAYVANSVLWNDGHTKVFIIYYDKKREKFVLEEKFLSMKKNHLRHEINNTFINIVVKEKGKRLVYLLMS